MLQLRVNDQAGSQATLQQQAESYGTLDAVWQRLVQPPGAQQAAAKLDRTATPASVLVQRLESGSTGSPMCSLSHLSSFGARHRARCWPHCWRLGVPQAAARAGLHAVPEAPPDFPGPELAELESAAASGPLEPVEEEEWLLEFARSQIGSCDLMNLDELVCGPAWRNAILSGPCTRSPGAPLLQDAPDDPLDSSFLAALLQGSAGGDDHASGLLRQRTV